MVINWFLYSMMKIDLSIQLKRTHEAALMETRGLGNNNNVMPEGSSSKQYLSCKHDSGLDVIDEDAGRIIPLCMCSQQTIIFPLI